MCQGMPTAVLVIVSLCNVFCVRACLPLYLLLLVFVMSYVSGHGVGVGGGSQFAD